MPLDNTNYQQDEKQKARDRGYQLVYALRQPLLNFRWRFTTIINECGIAGCACGYAKILWPELNDLVDDVTVIGARLGVVDSNSCVEIFSYDGVTMRYRDERNTWAVEVTPEMVADKLEEYLNNAG